MRLYLFPWGIPSQNDTGYGASIRTELLPISGFKELEKRMVIFYSGITRASTDVNSVWMNALSQPQGFRLHRLKLDIAYRFREDFRLDRWDDVSQSMNEYQKVRASLCAAYMEGAKEIQGFADDKKCVVFPLGAGGGGGILVFGPDPDSLTALRQKLGQVYRGISFKILAQGHTILNLPLKEAIS